MPHARFSPLSLQQKLAALILGTCAGALLLACIALTGWQYFVSRDLDTARNVELAQVIASNVGPAIMFNDAAVARETAYSLSQVDTIREVRVRDARGQLLASYVADGVQPAAHDDPEAFSPARTVWHERSGVLHIVAPSRVNGTHAGYVEVEAKALSIGAMLGQYLGVAALVFLVALAGATLLARHLQKGLFASIDGLISTMRRFRATPDYAMRVAVPQESDIAGIFEGFNALMADMQARDDRLALVMDDLKAARDQAEAANVAKSQFLSNMSHELRTPLNAIIAYADLVQEDLEAEGASQMVDDVKIIATSSRHLLHLINDILDFAKIEAGKAVLDLHAFDLGELVHEVSAILEPLAQKNGNRLHLQIDPGIGQVVLDSVKLKQSLINLGGNAAKFTNGGHIVLSARPDDDDRIVLTISDTGIGMTETQLGALFQPFNQGDASTTRKFGGTGLGLTITRRFIELMGGRIEVTSVPDLGTTFTISVPRRIEEVTGAAVQPDIIVERQPGERPIALIIDDEPTAREILSRWLQPHGFEVRTAENGHDGLAKARSLQPAIILLDIGMPHVDGWDVLRALKDDPALGHIPTIVTTIDDRRKLGLELGATEYLRKPLDREQLMGIVATFCDKSAGRVLLVEDDQTTADLYARGLRQAGYEVVHEPDGAAAVTTLSSDASFDVVVADLMMPNRDGFSLVETLRKRPELGEMPVLIITAKNLQREDHDRLDGKVDKILPKTGLSPRQIVQAVQSSLSAERKTG